MPEITRRSSTRRAPHRPLGSNGSIRAHSASLNQVSDLPISCLRISRSFESAKSLNRKLIEYGAYTLDLSQMDRSRLRWSEETSTLDVQLPPLRVGRPNLDEGRAQYLREGIWISRDAQDSLTRQNTRLAEQQAVEQAANPVLMGLARSAAKDAIRQTLAIPLEVAGFGEVTVNVRFDGEAAPTR